MSWEFFNRRHNIQLSLGIEEFSLTQDLSHDTPISTYGHRSGTILARIICMPTVQCQAITLASVELILIWYLGTCPWTSYHNTIFSFIYECIWNYRLEKRRPFYSCFKQLNIGIFITFTDFQLDKIRCFVWLLSGNVPRYHANLFYSMHILLTL